MGSGMTGVAKILYGLLFVVFLPLSLVLFSMRPAIPISIARLPLAGAVLSVLGLVLMLWGMRDIWKRGKGLPMNAFPPERLVADGIYAWVPHPIYTGFVLICLGVSLFSGSATGAFLTTPLVALSATALVLGYERPYILRTFGELPRPVLGIANLLGPLARAMRLHSAWAGALAWTERLANSWSATRIGMITATIASPAMNPEASGTRCFVACFGALRFHIRATRPPRNIVMIALAGTSMPMPIPVGDGTLLFHLVPSSTVNRIPSTTAIPSAASAPWGSADSPPASSFANPDHFCEIGDCRPFSPPIP